MVDTFLDIGTTVSIQKLELDNLLDVMKQMGYEIVGPKVKDHASLIAIEVLSLVVDIGHYGPATPPPGRLAPYYLTP